MHHEGENNIASFIDRLLFVPTELLSDTYVDVLRVYYGNNINSKIPFSETMAYKYRVVTFISLLKAIEYNANGFVLYRKDCPGFDSNLMREYESYFELLNNIFNKVNGKE